MEECVSGKNKSTIIIVNYNTRELIIQCLNTLMQQRNHNNSPWRIIVIDNGSIDGSVQEVRKRFANATIIQNKTNKGFAAANNQGIKKSDSEYVLLLNSDTIAQPDAITTVLGYMDSHQDVGVATCKLVLTDGQIDPACHRGFPTPWAAFTYSFGLEKLFPKSKVFSQYHQWYKDLSTIHEIDSPSGAFFMVRQKVIDQVGMLDESFFMYGEDLDWAYRIKQAGWKIIFIPDATVTHIKKQSGRSHDDKSYRSESQNHFYRTMKQFYDKHYRLRYSGVMNMLVTCTINTRLLILKYLHK